MPLGLTRLGLATSPRTEYYWQDEAVSRTLTAESGSFALTGNDAQLTKVSAYSISADVGSFALTGNDAQLTKVHN